jgi:hypothetical protein
MDHFLLMVWHAVLMAVFFAFLWRSDRGNRRRLVLKILLITIAGSTVLGWLMFPFP